MDADKKALIDALVQARAKLNSSLAKVSPQAEIYPAWKVKHLLDHITGWDELLASTFRTYMLGGTPERVVKHGINWYNAQSVDVRKQLSDEQSRQAYDSARAEVIQALKDMPEDKFGLEFHAPWGGSCTVVDIVKIFSYHELEHAKQLEEAAPTEE